MRRVVRFRVGLLLALVLAVATSAMAQAPIVNKVTVPEPQHHWLQVEATFPDIGRAPLHLQMSRSSPGRYALHEFAKNLFDDWVYDGKGLRAALLRLTPSEWSVSGPRRHGEGHLHALRRPDRRHLSRRRHDARAPEYAGDVHVGARPRGPADPRRPFAPPTARLEGRRRSSSRRPIRWVHRAEPRVLHGQPDRDPALSIRTFTLPTPTASRLEFRVALHHDGTDADVDDYARLERSSARSRPCTASSRTTTRAPTP